VSLPIVATCALGLEEILAGELAELGVSGLERRQAAVAFTGTWEDVYRANWRLRTANRVLVELGQWGGSDGDSLAGGAGDLVASSRAWEGLTARELFDPGRAFAIRATSSRSRQRDVRWIALKVKDGIVDAQRRRFGRRASVDRREPDLQLRVRLLHDRAALLLDTSGEPLDRRGYRVVPGTAPVREQLAAACILASGWDGRGPVVDPMCGSGTLLAEAAFWCLGVAPGALRAGWAFEKLPRFDRGAWRRVQREPIRSPGPGVRLFGLDRAPAAIRAAEENLTRAGLADIATLKVGDAFAFDPPPGPGLVVVNPPHGERLDGGEDEGDLWPRLGDLLKQRYTGWRAAILAGGEGQGKTLGLKPRRRIPVKTGPLDARILVLDLY
jgi:putative N6-adenine-specific DNA methylase